METLSLFQNHLQSSVSLSSKCNEFVKFAEIIAKNAGIRACAFPGPISRRQGKKYKSMAEGKARKINKGMAKGKTKNKGMEKKKAQQKARHSRMKGMAEGKARNIKARQNVKKNK